VKLSNDTASPRRTYLPSTERWAKKLSEQWEDEPEERQQVL
jgi:hypothetical protein